MPYGLLYKSQATAVRVLPVHGQCNLTTRFRPSKGTQVQRAVQRTHRALAVSVASKGTSPFGFGYQSPNFLDDEASVQLAVCEQFGLNSECRTFLGAVSTCERFETFDL